MFLFICITCSQTTLFLVKFDEAKRDISPDLKELKIAFNSPALLFNADITTHMDRFVTGTRGWMHQVSSTHYSYIFIAEIT